MPDRRLHRFLRRHSSRDQCRQAVPARQSAAAQLQICADRLSRPRELGARVGRAGGPAQAASASRPTPTRPNMARAAASITSWSSASGSAAATSSAQPIPIGEAGEHIAGYCLLNDWSARDLQAWEYQPLGPFLAKNFLTSVSPWVVSAEALAPFRKPMPPRPAGDPAAACPISTIRADRAERRARHPARGDAVDRADARGRASRRTSCRAARPTRRCTGARRRSSPITASNGCNLQPGDLIGTGTLSTDSDERPRLAARDQPAAASSRSSLPSGETRSFLEDGDEVTLRAWCEATARCASASANASAAWSRSA